MLGQIKDLLVTKTDWHVIDKDAVEKAAFRDNISERHLQFIIEEYDRSVK